MPLSAIKRWNCSLLYWAALIGMVQQLLRLAATPDGHQQGIGDQLRGHGGAHRPADHPAREQVDHGRYIKLALRGPDVGEDSLLGLAARPRTAFATLALI
jgi:hypothetical protein